jgi:hypothetical protein
MEQICGGVPKWVPPNSEREPMSQESRCGVPRICVGIASLRIERWDIRVGGTARERRAGLGA